MSKKALVIQGGGFKTAFTAGVLDAFIVSNHNPFDIYAGVSGGANALSYFLSGRYKSCIESIHVLLDDPRFINYKQLFTSGLFMNLDFFEEIAATLVPLDLETIFNNHGDKKIGIVATNRISGKPEYLAPTAENWVSCLIASCAVPFITKAKHEINGFECMDGSWSDPIPVRLAVDQGATDITVIRTSFLYMKEKQSLPNYFGEKYFKNNPALAQIFSRMHLQYNDSIDFMLDPPEGIKIRQIAPFQKLKTGNYTNSKVALEMDYRYGLEMGLDFLKKKQIN